MRWKPDCKCNPLSASMSSLLDPDTEAASSPELEKDSSHVLAGPAWVSGEVITTLYEYYCPLFFSLLKYPISQLRTLF